MGAGPAREREQSSRQDSRDLESGPPTTSLESRRVAKPPFRGQGPLPQEFVSVFMAAGIEYNCRPSKYAVRAGTVGRGPKSLYKEDVMQVSVETTSGLERRLTVGVPAEKVDSAVDTKLREAQKSVRLNGFRPGKVPMREVKRRFGDAVRNEVLADVMRESFIEAVEQESLQPAGMPGFEATKNEAGQDLEFVATFEVYPDV